MIQGNVAITNVIVCIMNIKILLPYLIHVPNKSHITVTFECIFNLVTTESVLKTIVTYI